MKDNDLQALLSQAPTPTPDAATRQRHLQAALVAYRLARAQELEVLDEGEKKKSIPRQGSMPSPRLTRVSKPIYQRMREFVMTSLTRPPSVAAVAFTIACIAVGAGVVFTYLESQDPLSMAPLAVGPAPEAPTEAIATGVRERQLAPADELAQSFEASPRSQAPAAPMAGEEIPGGLAATDVLTSKRDGMATAAPPPPAAAARSLPASPVPSMPSRPPVLPVPEANREQYAPFEESAVKQVAEAPVSTFSIDVDTASYSLMRSSLMNGQLPAPSSIRLEELINYFDYDYPVPPTIEAPFAVDMALVDSPWSPGTLLLRVGVQGYEVQTALPRSNLVFLIDTSGSMNQRNKLPLLKSSLKLLLNTLDDDDTVAIATYAGSAGVALEPTAVAEKAKILQAIDTLQPGGSTAGAAGIELAYQLATQSFDTQAVNRVFLATDGDFNVGIANPEALEDFIAEKRDSGVYLSVLGFGRGNVNDAIMQSLAQAGNGNAAYIDTLNEARKVLVDQAQSTVIPIANDVKIQIEFNPQQVAEYRLLGYETRALAREDFNNDAVDAGEVGSGQSVTALYELTPVGSEARRVDELRYGDEATVTPDPEAEYAFFKLRYKPLGSDQSRLISQPVTPEDRVAEITQDPNTCFAAAVAAFGLRLKNDRYIGDYGYDQIAQLGRACQGDDADGYRAEFLNLVRLAQSLTP